MADVPMTRAEAVKLIEAHEHVVRRWAGAHHDKIEEAADEQLQSREALIAALTRPAPSPSDVEAVRKTPHSSDDPRKFIIETIRENFDKAPDLGDASYPAFESGWNDGAEEIADLILARMRGAAVPDELMSALATLFHGYCRLEDGDQKFAMVVPPDWTWQGRHPSDCVKAWAVVCDTVYPAAPEVPR